MKEIKQAVAKNISRDNRRSRPRPEGCWSFCGSENECILELLGLCRKSLPRFESPAPNQGVDRLRGLVFGRQDYDTEVLSYQKEFNRNYAKSIKTNQDIVLPEDWRKRLKKPDPWALVPITHDAKRYIKHDKNSQVWDANLLEDMLLGNVLCTSDWISKTILSIHEMACTVGTSLFASEREKAKIVLMSLFNTEYKSILLERNPEYAKTWQIAIQVFLSATTIILDFLLESYFKDTETWISLLVKHKAKLNYGVDIDYLKPKAKLQNKDIKAVKAAIKEAKNGKSTGTTKPTATGATGIKLRPIKKV